MYTQHRRRHNLVHVMIMLTTTTFPWARKSCYGTMDGDGVAWYILREKSYTFAAHFAHHRRTELCSILIVFLYSIFAVVEFVLYFEQALHIYFFEVCTRGQIKKIMSLCSYHTGGTETGCAQLNNNGAPATIRARVCIEKCQISKTKLLRTFLWLLGCTYK